MKEFGPATLALKTGRETFTCPLCGEGASAWRVLAIAAFFAGWIPLAPYRILGIYRDCRSCRMTYEPDGREPVACRAIRRILAHGLRHRAPVRRIDLAQTARIYEEVTGIAQDPEAFEPHAKESGAASLRRRLQHEFPYLNARGVALCLSAAFMQIADDGVFEEWERTLLCDVAAGFRIPLGAAIPVIQNIAAGQVARM